MKIYLVIIEEMQRDTKAIPFANDMKAIKFAKEQVREGREINRWHYYIGANEGISSQLYCAHATWSGHRVRVIEEELRE